jgi:FkbM family methyltransferase
MIGSLLDFAKSAVPRKLKQKVRCVIDEGFRARQNEFRRLSELPRRTPTTTDLLGASTHMVDAASFLSAYRAIFQSEIYAFEPADPEPTIIDGGANIGLATIYWKRHFPDAEIIAFEPDPRLYETLKQNLEEHEYGDVRVVRKGLWSEDTTLKFQPDGADGGHVAGGENEGADMQQIPVTRLVPYLNNPVDLLKLDIEGAEVEVLNDAAGHLGSVQNLFVEWHSYIGEEQRIDDILRVLQEADFRIHVQPELVADQPFLERLESAGMDHRLNIFAYRG